MAFLLLLLLFCPNVAAQKPSKLDLLKVELCTLQAPDGYLDEFWQLCASPMNDETTPIIHLGDSHVQGGYFSMPIRQFFRSFSFLRSLACSSFWAFQSSLTSDSAALVAAVLSASALCGALASMAAITVSCFSR